MAVKLRLARHGSKKRPFYRIVAAQDQARRDGRFLEQLGTYDPTHKDVRVALKRDRITEWLGNGAQPTDTVQSILNEYMDKADTAIRATPRKAVKAAPKAEAPKAEAPKAAAPKAEVAEAPKAAEAVAEAPKADAPAEA